MNPAFFKFPVDFSLENLLYDLQICEDEEWVPHFNKMHYQGQWTSIALRSATGTVNDITSFANETFIDTPLLDKCMYFQKVLNWFQCDKEAVRLLRLAPKSEIKEHTDHDTSYEDNYFRIHIPILTNDDIRFVVNEEVVPMRPGSCWYANFQLPHSVVNNSEQPRVHLVIDCIRNAWSDVIFAKAGFDISKTSSQKELSPEVKKKIIEELMRSSNSHAQELAESLQKELHNNASIG